MWKDQFFYPKKKKFSDPERASTLCVSFWIKNSSLVYPFSFFFLSFFSFCFIFLSLCNCSVMMGKGYGLLCIFIYVLLFLGNAKGQCSSNANIALSSTPSMGTNNDGTISFSVSVVVTQPPGSMVTTSGVWFSLMIIELIHIFK